MSYYAKPPTPDEIYHHGVLGMKWGVRRYQNADGSLTSAGRKHYNKQANKAVKKERKEAVKNRRTMSDNELQQRINRLNLEKKMKDLSDDDVNPGKKAVNSALQKAGKTVMTAAVVGTLAYAGKQAVKHGVPRKAAKKIYNVARTAGKNAPPKAKNVGKKVFNKEKAKKHIDAVDWDELARFAFPNPNKKK